MFACAADFRSFFFLLASLSARAAGLVGRRVEGRTLTPLDSVSLLFRVTAHGFQLHSCYKLRR